MIQTQWHNSYLTRWLFEQDKYWITAAGDQLEIAEMDSSHLLNTLTYVERVAVDIWDRYYDNRFHTREQCSEWLVETPLYEALREEVYSRMKNRPRPVAENIRTIPPENLTFVYNNGAGEIRLTGDVADRLRNVILS